MELHTSLLHKRSVSDYFYNIIVEGKSGNTFNSPYNPEPEQGKETMRESIAQERRHFANNTKVQDSMKKEILELQKQLENQFAERGALESAMFSKPVSDDFVSEYSISKTAKDLIKEVTILEMEVSYLEKYLLSMYRKTFALRLNSQFMLDENPKANSATKEQLPSEVQQFKTTVNSVNAGCSMPSEDSVGKIFKESRDVLGAQILVDSSIARSHSSLSQRSPISFRTSLLGSLAEAVDSYHSLPLSMLEGIQSSDNASPAEHCSTRLHDRLWEMPNKISEEMIKSISAIYYQLAQPPLHGFPSSPVSVSTSRTSPIDHHDAWNLHGNENSWLNSSFHIESSKDFNTPVSTVVEVQGIHRDAQSLCKIEPMLEKFRYLISALELVDPKKMKQEEKLAFWINVHNSLVMHALLVYGIQRSNVKRISLLLKAAYNIGGHTISVDMIQSSVLACRLPRPGQWLQSFFFPRSKYKGRDSWKAYAIGHPEPRLHFALCSGSYSDPVVRLYTPKRIFQDLEVAKEEYIQSNAKIQRELKLQLPKKVETFVKESDLSPAGFKELIEHSVPNSLRQFQQPHKGKVWKNIVWNPHNFNFRYLISDELFN